jgi:hypothetical protein
MEEFVLNAVAETADSDLEKLKRSLWDLVAQSTISFRAISDQDFLVLCRRMIRLGQLFPDKDPRDLIPRCSRKSVTCDFPIDMKVHLDNQVDFHSQI